MELKRIVNSNSPEAEKLLALQAQTFPEYVRYQETPLLANMIDNEKSMSFNAVYDGGELAGFFIYWDLDDCYYIHFIAIFPEMRNLKTGQRLLDWVSENLHQPVFLEAEIPYDELTARRLAFYKRNGFRELAEDPATLAEHRGGGHPLWFMGTQAVEDTEYYLRKIKARIYDATGAPAALRKLVIIPTYNEKENVSAMIDKVFSLEEKFELLIIDDGSPDGTAAIVRERQHDFPETLHLLERSGKLGLGTAYLLGFRWGLEHGFDYICEMDCDFSHNPDDLVRLYRTAASENCDVVVGSRYVQGVNVVNWPMSRLLLSYFASKYVRIVTRMPLHDATAGFVCYSRRALETIDLERIRMKGYGFQIEMKYSAWRLGMRLKEVSIIFVDRREGTSKMSGGIFGEAFFGVLKLPFRCIRARSFGK